MPPERPFALGDASVRAPAPRGTAIGAPRRASAPVSVAPEYVVSVPSAPAERAPALGLMSGRGLY